MEETEKMIILSLDDLNYGALNNSNLIGQRLPENNLNTNENLDVAQVVSTQDVGDVRVLNEVEISDLTSLQQLLEDWNLLQLLPSLQGSGITYRSLLYLSKDDIKDAIHDIGLRAEFREKLFLWRKSEHNIDDDTITYRTKVDSWLQTNSEDTSATSKSKTYPESISKLSKKLADLLGESNKGKAVLQHYVKHSCLDKLRRDALVSLILEDIQYNGLYLSPKDYPPILQEIESTFPNEKNFLDYYFFTRNKRKNPGGRLYNKYVNASTKIRKIGHVVKATSPVQSANLPDQEFDKDILNSLKAVLRRDKNDWNDVKDKWEKTFILRQQELNKSEKSNVAGFLKEWPCYSHANSKDLFDIDFRILFPGKDILLYSRWEDFKKSIRPFYTKNIKDKSCRQLFSVLADNTETNAEDYILTTLLNSVILPTGRFGVEKGSNKRKVTIKDAQESFTLRIPTLNDFERSVEELRNKHYNKGLTLQPFIVVVGFSADQLTDYFVYFDKCRQKHDSYLSCLNTCFKIFHVLGLEYPQASYGPWFFIQRYFFGIETKFDKPLPSVSSLIGYLNNH